MSVSFLGLVLTLMLVGEGRMMGWDGGLRWGFWGDPGVDYTAHLCMFGCDREISDVLLMKASD